MLYIKAFHIIAMVAWFAGLFYLPRLFVYHAASNDKISLDRFKLMEYRLYYFIMCPAAVITTMLGFWMLSYNSSYYLQANWMHIKLGLVLFLWVYHCYCGYWVKQFALHHNTHSMRFYRIINEIPTLFLIAIVLLVVLKIPG